MPLSKDLFEQNAGFVVISRLMLHAKDVRDLFVYPMLAAILPRRMVYGILQRRFLRSGSYVDEAAATVAGRARVHLHSLQSDALHDDFRFLKLLANADIFRLALGRTVALNTEMPTAAAQGGVGTLVLSVHWGSAIGLLRAFAQQNGGVHFVNAPLDRAEFRDRPVRLWFARLSIAVTQRAARAPCIFTGAARSEISSALAAGRHVCILYDVPSHLVGSTAEVDAGEARFQLPRGFAEIAVKARAPVLFFAHCPSREISNAPRTLIKNPRVYADEHDLLQASAAFLQSCLDTSAAGWHMWQHSNELFAASHLTPGVAP